MRIQTDGCRCMWQMERKCGKTFYMLIIHIITILLMNLLDFYFAWNILSSSRQPRLLAEADEIMPCFKRLRILPCYKLESPLNSYPLQNIPKASVSDSFFKNLRTQLNTTKNKRNLYKLNQYLAVDCTARLELSPFKSKCLLQYPCFWLQNILLPIALLTNNCH